jgi:hypothetical protein
MLFGQKHLDFFFAFFSCVKFTNFTCLLRKNHQVFYITKFGGGEGKKKPLVPLM